MNAEKLLFLQLNFKWNVDRTVPEFHWGRRLVKSSASRLFTNAEHRKHDQKGCQGERNVLNEPAIFKAHYLFNGKYEDVHLYFYWYSVIPSYCTAMEHFFIIILYPKIKVCRFTQTFTVISRCSPYFCNLKSFWCNIALTLIKNQLNTIKHGLSRKRVDSPKDKLHQLPGAWNSMPIGVSR